MTWNAWITKKRRLITTAVPVRKQHQPCNLLQQQYHPHRTKVMATTGNNNNKNNNNMVNRHIQEHLTRSNRIQSFNRTNSPTLTLITAAYTTQPYHPTPSFHLTLLPWEPTTKNTSSQNLSHRPTPLHTWGNTLSPMHPEVWHRTFAVPEVLSSNRHLGSALPPAWTLILRQRSNTVLVRRLMLPFIPTTPCLSVRTRGCEYDP